MGKHINVILEGLCESRVCEAKKPKSWNSMFAVNVIKAYKSEELTKKNIPEWNKAYNGGIEPNPPFDTLDIINYYEATGKEPS